MELLQREIQPTWRLPEIELRVGVLFVIAMIVSVVLRRGRSWVAVSESSIARLILLSLAICGAWLGAEFVLTRVEGIPRQLFLRYAVVLPLLLISAHWVTATILRALHLSVRTPDGVSVAMVMGRAADSRALIEYLHSLPDAVDVKVSGIVTDERTPLRTVALKPVMGAGEDLVRIMERLCSERRLPRVLLLATDRTSLAAASRAALDETVRRYGVKVVDVAEGLRSSLNLVREVEIGRLPRTTEDGAPVTLDPGYLLVRRALDIAASTTGLLIAMLPMGLVAGLIRVSLGAPILFKQERIGRFGRPIVVYKFRTMRFASTIDGKDLPDSERHTRVGGALRRLRLDELPQLWNVLRGDLSFVGPRPLVAEDIERLPDRGYLRSFLRPGLTGWAQIHGGQALSDEEKFILDAWYLKRASLWLDARILLMTPVYLFQLERIRLSDVNRCREEIRDDARRWMEQARLSLVETAELSLNLELDLGMPVDANEAA